MGRTSKLSRKFDMVLFVIFAMGIFVIILSVGAEYSWDWWITVISYVVLLSIVVCIMGTGYYYNKTIEYQKEDGQLQKRKIKNGYSSFCNSECTVTITKFENQQMDEIRQKLFEIQNLVFDMQIKANNKSDGSAITPIEKTYTLSPQSGLTLNVGPSGAGTIGIEITIDESTNDIDKPIEVPGDWVDDKGEETEAAN